MLSHEYAALANGTDNATSIDHDSCVGRATTREPIHSHNHSLLKPCPCHGKGASVHRNARTSARITQYFYRLLVGRRGALCHGDGRDGDTAW